jgi:uncharacterized protein YecE (DUF72 family)
VYVYFNNDDRGYAVANALELCERLGIPPAPVEQSVAG